MNSPKLTSPIQIAERVGIVAEKIQLELRKNSPDMNQINKWLWEIRQASVPLQYHLTEV